MNSVNLEGKLPIPQQRCACRIGNLPSKSSLLIRAGSHRCFERPEIDPARCRGTCGNPAAGAKTWRQRAAQKTSKRQRAPTKRAPERWGRGAGARAAFWDAQKAIGEESKKIIKFH